MSDSEVRALARETDLTALEVYRLETARARALTPLETARVELTRWHETRETTHGVVRWLQPTLGELREAARGAYLSSCPGSALPRGAREEIEALVRARRAALEIEGPLHREAIAMDQQIAHVRRREAYLASPEGREETARLEAVRIEGIRRAEEAERLAASARARIEREAPRALGLPCFAEALKLAEGTAKSRTLKVADVLDLVRVAREHGSSTIEADHDVAKSYKYPVSYTRAEARRLADGSVLVEIVRTQTWGSRRDSIARVVAPVDVATS